MTATTFKLKNFRLLAACVAAAAVLSGCTRHTVQVQPIRIEPIYMTIDVNVKVDRELDEFFDYKEKPQLPEDAPVDPEPAAPSEGGQR